MRNIPFDRLFRATVGRRRRAILFIGTFTSPTRRDGITALEGVRAHRSTRETYHSFNG